MAKKWDYTTASDRIDKRLSEVEKPVIKTYTRDMSLENIPKNTAYRVDGVHLYADILNLADMLDITDVEGVIAHRKTLRFLNLHYRAVHRLLSKSDTKRVDFHNERLHAVVIKPYNTAEDAETIRVHRAVAIGQLIIDVLKETGDADDGDIPAAKVRIGIDTGEALAVNNGRRGGLESLFLGRPANKAAKRANGGKAIGIYLTNEARAAIGLEEIDEDKLDKTPLTASEIAKSEQEAVLGVTKDEIIKDWNEDLKNNPIGSFEFFRHTPPLKTLPIVDLTPGNSRRQELISIYADLDGFTTYVDRHIESNPEDVVKALHVIRSEMDSVLTLDFGGRKIRFIGDCIHGILAEGTVHQTDEEETITTGTLCAGGIRSSFDLCLEKLEEANVDIGGLGLQIGLEYGPVATTRLGMRGDRVRCSIGRGVLASEDEQGACSGKETALGEIAYATGTDAVRKLFGDKRKVKDLDYDTAVTGMALDEDEAAKAAARAGYRVTAPAMAKSIDQPLRAHCKK